MIRLKKLFEIKGYSLFLLCMLLVGIGVSITLPYLSLYCTEVVGMSTGAFGLLIAISSLSGVVVNSFIAKRSDSELDRKWLIISAMLSAALGYVSYLIFHNYFILLITVTVFSGIGAAAMPQIFAYAQESANASQSDDKTFALSTLRSLVSLGFVVGPIFGTIILGALGYRGLFLGTSSIYLVITILVLFFLRKRPIQINAKKTMADASMLKSKQIWQPLISFVFLLALNAINGLNTPLFIVHVLHGTHSDVGLVVSLSAFLEIPIMIGLGALGRKISNHALLISGSLIAVVYYIILSVSTQTWQLIVAQLLQATFVAIVMGNGLSYFTEFLPNSPGVAVTLYSNGSTIGKLLGNIGGGMVAQFAGFRHVYWVCLGIATLAFVILWRTKPREEMEVSLENTGSM